MAKKLTSVEEFYIDNHQSDTDEEIALELGKPIELVREHLHKVKSESRVNRLLIREKGCTVMTAGASEALDNSRGTHVSENAIKKALADGNYEEAARLQNLLKEQRRQSVDEQNSTGKEYIHYMKKGKDSRGVPHR